MSHCGINNYFCVAHRSKYFRGKRIHGDWDIRVEQVGNCLRCNLEKNEAKGLEYSNKILIYFFKG